MGLDPRRASGSAQGRAAQTISELEARIARLENSTKGAILASGMKSQTSSVTMGTSQADVTGCTVTLAAQVPTLLAVTFTGNVSITFSSNPNYQQASVVINLDGTSGPSPGGGALAFVYGSHASGTLYSDISASIAQGWQLTLPAGTHTVKLRHYARIAGATLTNSTMSYLQTRA